MLFKASPIFIHHIVFYFIASVCCQDWSDKSQFDAFDGTRLAHVYADFIRIETGTVINFAQTYAFTIPEGIFI